MFSSGEESDQILFSWMNDRAALGVLLEFGPNVSLSGRGTLADWDSCGMKLSGSAFWELSLVFEANVSVESKVPADDPRSVIVMIVSGSTKCMLTGPRPVLGLGF